MLSIERDDLAGVIGATGRVAGVPDDRALGRCGPDTRWKFLGNVHTPQCMAHDLAVRKEEAKGTPHWMAQLEAAPKLPGAIASYVKAIV